MLEKFSDVTWCWVYWYMLSGTFFGCQLWFGIWWHQYGHGIASPRKVVPWGPWCQVELSLQTSSNFIQFRLWFVIIMRLQVGLMLEVLLFVLYCPLMFVFGDMETCLPCCATARLFQDRRWHETLDHLDRNMQAFPNGRSGKKIINLSPCASCTTFLEHVFTTVTQCRTCSSWQDVFCESGKIRGASIPNTTLDKLSVVLCHHGTAGALCMHTRGKFFALQGFGSLFRFGVGGPGGLWREDRGRSWREYGKDINLCNWLTTFVHLCLVVFGMFSPNKRRLFLATWVK